MLAAAAEHGITDGICTGDVVMRGPDPGECIAVLRSVGWPTVAGNTDRKVVAGDPRPMRHPASRRVGSRSWTHRHLGDADLAWLGALPPIVRREFGGARIVVVHGDAQTLSTPITSDTPERAIERQLKKLDADVLVIGHTHTALVRDVRGGMVINPGAVGESRDPDWRPRWAWLEATADGVVPHLELVDTPLAPVRDDAPDD